MNYKIMLDIFIDDDNIIKDEDLSKYLKELLDIGNIGMVECQVIEVND